MYFLFYAHYFYHEEKKIPYITKATSLLGLLLYCITDDSIMNSQYLDMDGYVIGKSPNKVFKATPYVKESDNVSYLMSVGKYSKEKITQLLAFQKSNAILKFEEDALKNKN